MDVDLDGDVDLIVSTLTVRARWQGTQSMARSLGLRGIDHVQVAVAVEVHVNDYDHVEVNARCRPAFQ